MSPRKTESAPVFGPISLNSADAIDVGLFASGPARIAESLFTPYDYKGSASRTPPVVWLVKFERGTGRDLESYDQAYSIGSGLAIDKKTGRIYVEADPSQPVRLPKTCNAILHLIRPLEAACAAAGIEMPALSDPSMLEGLEVVLERVEQTKRQMSAFRGGRGRRGAAPADPVAEERARREAEEREAEFGPKTILEIRQVTATPWGGSEKQAAKPAARPNGKPAPAVRDDEDDEDEDDTPSTPAAIAKPNGKAAPEPPAPVPAHDITEEATEAIVALLEKGKLPVSRLEADLEKSLRDNPNAAAIIDLATSGRFLRKELAWSISKDGKTLDALSHEA